MYLQQCLMRQRHQELVRQAERHRSGRQVTELRRLERRQRRAERELLLAWQRVDQLRSALRVAS